MLTRSQTKQQSSCINIDENTRSYNTRLQKRLNSFQKEEYNHKYFTRSKEVNIDFDESSRMWNKNKKRVGQMYKYI